MKFRRFLLPSRRGRALSLSLSSACGLLFLDFSCDIDASVLCFFSRIYWFLCRDSEARSLWIFFPSLFGFCFSVKDSLLGVGCSVTGDFGLLQVTASSSSLTAMSSLIVSSAAFATTVLPHSSESSIRLAAPVFPSLATLLRLSNKSVIRRRFPVVAMASSRGSQVTKPADNLYQQVEKSIAEAQEVCVADETSGECRVAWETVEELAAEVAHRRTRAKSVSDPLESYCKEAPEADECRVYED